MKKIVTLLVLSLSILPLHVLVAGDDVYDAIKQREIKVKHTYSTPSDQTEKSVPYSEEDNSSNRRPSSDYSNDGGYNQSDSYYADDWNYSYSDRIRRFHNPSIRFSMGWSSFNNYWSDPWNSYNSFGSYSFTPTWVYSYNDFYNPFWGSGMMVYYDPWMSGYNTGYYDPYNSWNYYSPACATYIYNNAYPYYGYGYGSQYDAPRKNVVNTPRSGGYNNTNVGNNGHNYNNPSGSGNNSSNSVAPAKKWNRAANPNPAPANQDVYKYNHPGNNNSGNWNRGNNTNPPPSNNNDWGKSDGSGGIKLGTKPK